MRAQNLALCLAASVVAVGCVSSPTAPQPERVDPPRGFGGDAQPVDIFGSAFYPLIIADASGPAGDVVDSEFTVELIDPTDGSVASVSRASLVGRGSGHLTTIIPAGVEVGAYDLRLTGPDGAVGTLPDAYQVTNSPVEKLQVAVPSPGEWFVGEPAQIALQLVGRDDLNELASLPIEAVLQRVEGGAIRGNMDSNLVDAVQLDLGPDRIGVAGTTRADGSGLLDIDMPDEGVYTLSVRIPDPDVGLDPVVRRLTWLSGDVYDVEVGLPQVDFQTLAGSAFPVDLTLRDKETGAVVEQPSIPVRVVLSDLCGDIEGGVLIEDLKGTRTELVTLTTATSDAVPFGGCDAQALRIRLASDVFTSEPVRVLPGPSERLAVEPLSSSVIAGEPQRAIVRVADRFQNVTGDDLDARSLLLTDTVGDVDTVGCEAIDGGAFCVVTPTDAERAVSLIARDPKSNLQGNSAPYAVLASVPDTYRVLLDPASGIVAGAPFPVVVRVYDEYGNDADTLGMVEGDIVVTDLLSEAGCSWGGPAERGEVAFTCSLFTAGRNRLIARGTANGTSDGSGSAGEVGLSGTSAEFSVVNADLERVEVVLSAATVTAGDRLRIDLAGFDAFDNAFVVRPSSRLDLASVLDGLDVDHVLFDPTGRASVETHLVAAGADSIVATYLGTEVGRSELVVVEAAEAAALSVRSSEPWGFVGERAEMHVQAVDAYGNHTELTDTVRVSSQWGTFSSGTTSLVDGRGTVEVAFDQADLAEVVRARTQGGLEGTLADFVVAEDCGTDGPSLTLGFDGELDAVTCHDGTSGEIDASFAGSVTATGSLPRLYALWSEESGTLRSATDRISLTSTRIGRHRLRGLVADADACAVEVERSAWVGKDDGQPVGPIDLSVASARLDIGSDKSSVSVEGALTCDGDLAEKGHVFVRTDRGSLTGATATGTGLRLTLDKNGDASATLDLFSDDSGGTGTITASVLSGAAGGTSSFTAVGDVRRPRILTQDPAGYTIDALDVIEVTFSEAIDADSVTTSAFSVAGPSTASIDEVELDSDGLVVTIWLTEAINAGAGRWTLTVADGIVDTEGNALDGAWSGVRGDYTGDFGKVSAIVPDMSSCVAKNPTFRPDGDPGTRTDSIESESVTVQAKATRTPAEWVLTVEDDAGTAVFVDRITATDKDQDLSWDGRDDSGRVLSDGTYSVVVFGVNADGSGGTSCVREVAVDNDRGR